MGEEGSLDNQGRKTFFLLLAFSPEMAISGGQERKKGGEVFLAAAKFEDKVVKKELLSFFPLADIFAPPIALFAPPFKLSGPKCSPLAGANMWN